MASSSKSDPLELKSVISSIQYNAQKIQQIYGNCSGKGSLSDDSTCNPKIQEQIRGYENKIFEQIGSYLKFGGGMSVGAGAAIYDEIMGIESDVVELADGTTLVAFENNLGTLKAKLSEYIVNESIDFEKIQNNLLTKTTAIEQEISALLSELPGAINGLDIYNKGYYTGLIGGGAILELINPIKKPRLLAKGFTVGKWLYKARYLIDSNKAGHTLVQKIENMKKLDRINWSRVEKPDMGKITNQGLINSIKENYKDSATYGNGSTADAIRYQRTTGLLVNNRDHMVPGNEKITRLQNLIKGVQNLPALSVEEKKIAQTIIDDLASALNEKI